MKSLMEGTQSEKRINVCVRACVFVSDWGMGVRLKSDRGGGDKMQPEYAL